MSYSLVVGEPYPRQVNWPKSAATLVLSENYVEIIHSFDGLTSDELAAFTTGSATVAGWDVRSQRTEVQRRISLTGQSAAVDDALTAVGLEHAGKSYP